MLMMIMGVMMITMMMMVVMILVDRGSAIRLPLGVGELQRRCPHLVSLCRYQPPLLVHVAG